jgi:glyceraldehyde 3-phosphate dehydrogenase
MTKIAINGFGRIGRSTFRKILDSHPDLDIVAINDLTDNKTLAHLLKYDSVYGIYDKEISHNEKSLLVDNKEIKVFSEKDPTNLPWKELGIDVVLECTGVFRDYDGAKKHITAGAKKVIISAPGKSPEINSYILGINAEDYNPEKDEVMDMGSCTTNCLAPVVKVLHDNFKITQGFMTTIHSYTSDQRLLDLSHKDLRRARAAAMNIIPTTTGATKAIGKVIPELEGKLDGIAMRVPTPTVSVIDLVCQIEKSATKEQVNSAFEKATENDLKGILKFEQKPLVSSDYIGDDFPSIVDADLTMAEGNLVKVISWYDNEWGYSCCLAKFCEFIGKKL